MTLYTINLNDFNKSEQKLGDLKDLAGQLITDIRQLSVNLNGDRVVKMGLSRALEMEIERVNKTDLFIARFERNGDLFLEDDKTIILYRMVQESLNNIVKHSNAREINLSLFADENSIKLALSDNGDGFNVDEVTKNGAGAGLNNLRKRAKLINAKLMINSVIGKGTDILIELSYNNASPNLRKMSIDK